MEGHVHMLGKYDKDNEHSALSCVSEIAVLGARLEFSI